MFTIDGGAQDEIFPLPPRPVTNSSQQVPAAEPQPKQQAQEQGPDEKLLTLHQLEQAREDELVREVAAEGGLGRESVAVDHEHE